MTEKDQRSIHVPVLTRVEGEGALDLVIHEGKISELRLRIYEPPRLFEKFLEGYSYTQVPDMVARICGICPVAYQMSAIHALESVFKVSGNDWVRNMRRVFYCGEWIQSHALHIHLLAAPDFLGFESVIAMAQKYPQEVQRGLRLQAVGNRLIALFGGRSVHPVGAKVGGFYHAPAKKDVDDILEQLRSLQQDAKDLIAWTASLDLPEDKQEFTSVALRHDNEYPMNEGRLVSSQGLDIDIEEYQQHFKEFQAPHSTALHATLHDQPYLVGPLARLNLNIDRLPDTVHEIITATGISFPSDNMFHSIVARAIEIYYGLLESIRLLEAYEIPAQPYVEIKPRAGIASGCTEAPRGILWHQYQVDENGDIEKAIIIPPTSQNQARIEQDLRTSLTALGLNQDDDTLRQHGEMLIRNYDPCISCSTHFLKIKVERS